jgi:hypothetical protein
VQGLVDGREWSNTADEVRYEPSVQAGVFQSHHTLETQHHRRQELTDPMNTTSGCCVPEPSLWYYLPSQPGFALWLCCQHASFLTTAVSYVLVTGNQHVAATDFLHVEL